MSRAIYGVAVAAVAVSGQGCDRVLGLTNVMTDARGSSDARPLEGPPSPDGHDAAVIEIDYVSSFAHEKQLDAMTVTLPFTAARAGDAFVLLVGCVTSLPEMPTVVGGGMGWNWSPRGTWVQAPGTEIWGMSFGAIAPDTTSSSVTVSTSSSCSQLIALGDEFAPAGFSTDPLTFDVGIDSAGSGDCSSAVTTHSNGDAIWAACISDFELSAPGPGYTKASDDGSGDWSEYRLTADPANTVETAAFANQPTAYLIAEVAIALGS